MAVRIIFTYQATRDHLDANGITRRSGETWDVVRTIAHHLGHAMPDDIIAGSVLRMFNRLPKVGPAAPPGNDPATG